MGEFFKNVTLGWLLRNIFGGVFVILVFRFVGAGVVGLLPGENQKLLEVEIPIALFAGVTAYALHRACIYPFIEAYLDSPEERSRRRTKPPISEDTVLSLYRAWGTGVAEGERHERYAVKLTGWADMTQFLYVSSLCMFVGCMGGVANIIGSNAPLGGWPIARAMIAVLIAIGFRRAALFSDRRLKRVRERMPIDPKNKPCDLPPETGDPSEGAPRPNSATPAPIPQRSVKA